MFIFMLLARDQQGTVSIQGKPVASHTCTPHSIIAHADYHKIRDAHQPVRKGKTSVLPFLIYVKFLRQ